MKRIDWRTRILLCAAILGIGFIFRNSFQVGAASHQWSSDVLTDLTTQFPFLSGLTEKVLRKLAHLTEYAVAGALLALLWTRPLPSRLRPFYLLLCAAIPCIDELIQLFSPGRNSQFFDVCIDWIGMLCGAAIIWILLRLWRARSQSIR